MEIKINRAYSSALTSQHRYLVLKGGAGSGKSIFTVQKLILRLTSEDKHRILCVRKVATTLRNSIYQLLIDKLIEYGIYNEFTINKSEMRFTHNPTGNELILHGMDDQEKIKSIAGITSVWCEEATELDELDFNQLELRVRGETATYKQFIITFNPISETHWIKARFFDKPDEDTLLLNTTYKDNHFLDADYIKHLTERVRNNENLYKVYVLGEWGKVDFGGEFLKCWSTVKHTSYLTYDPSLAIWLSFDENVNPYFPCGIFQISDENEIRMIDCIALKNPDNTTKVMGRTILAKLRQWRHNGFVYVCGDSTSQKDDVKQEKGFDLFRLLINELDEPNLTSPPVVWFVPMLIYAFVKGASITSNVTPLLKVCRALKAVVPASLANKVVAARAFVMVVLTQKAFGIFVVLSGTLKVGTVEAGSVKLTPETSDTIRLNTSIKRF